jgi:hypothetical protein
LVDIGSYVAYGQFTADDAVELVPYIAAAVLLELTFKTNAFTIWEGTDGNQKLAYRRRSIILPAANQLIRHEMQNGSAPHKTNNPAAKAKGSLIHAELADLMRADNMSTLKIEVSYDGEGTPVPYGTKGSIRLDYEVTNGGTTIGIFDLKPSEMINPTR